MALSHSPIIELDSIDSTNNYAMQLVDANKAFPGLTITAKSQTGGKGQRGKTWIDAPGQSLLMSIVTAPALTINEQFRFNACVAVAVANVLQKLYENWKIHIKWPNDIIINDKKAAGLLIENVLRGSFWAHSIIGIGLNVMQDNFPPDLPFATSLKIASGYDFDIARLRDDIRENILAATQNPLPPNAMEMYNAYLYKRGRMQGFSDATGSWVATISGVHNNGTIELQKEDGAIAFYHHGQVVWEWEFSNEKK